MLDARIVSAIAELGGVHQDFPYGFRLAVRPGFDGRGGEGPSWLAGMENVFFDLGGDGLRADVCDVV
jgi:hypothetical protein